ncbi:TrbG/VirB9 family P-type conjugative transfer protein [Campylobacter sp. MIT 97-5078]|uniref:TrbG/VirB9 family P-type conjugative transfer protein n=1 Tax=Campylobacter sp. MIT 97-5078 TaxID=1548153 RepID=UPI00068C336C|nr:TrbG/VirB9 family P-type conjugative transfer protein [Campylobacter sp. MIT 97-5078]TQR25593.1 type IV secretion system protein VirB9 [Campylobacter sp. MIT 97-5078]
MKKITLISICALSLTYSDVPFTSQPQTGLGLNRKEIEQAKQIAKELSNSNNVPMQTPTNSGESIFMSKDSTKNDFIGSSVRIDPLKEANSVNIAVEENQNYSAYPSQAPAMQVSGELTDEQIALLKSAARNKNLRAIQRKFNTKKYTGYENTKKYDFEADKTRKITTRFAMATTLIFSSPIESFVIGDNTGFLVNEMPNLSNALAIKPMLIGIDTSLTVFTKDKKLHTFYLYSTDYKSTQDPNLVIYINDEDGKKYEEAKKEKLKDYLVIEDGIARLLIKKTEIYDKYKQKALKKNAFLMAEEIFNDKQFTYFKYDKERMPQIPSIFVVIDKQDSPMETRVIGNYIIVETTAKKFTIRIGEAYVCVERLDPIQAKQNEDTLIEKTNDEIKTDINELFKQVEPKTQVEILPKDDPIGYEEERIQHMPKVKKRLHL